MSSHPISSPVVLKQQTDACKSSLSLPETEDSWESISNGISSLCAICRNGAFDFAADLIPIIRSISRPLTNAMNSERTRLSGTAMDFVNVLASGLGPGFDPLLPIFLPALLTLCGRPNKVVITRARTCIFTIVEATQLPSILSYFLPSIKEKSPSLRLVAAEGTLICMNCFNPPDLEKETRARDIEGIIGIAARDAHADVRKVGKKLFEAYKLLFPSRVERFTSPLTPTVKKYLDIKHIVTGPPAGLTSTSEVKRQLSSSTSTLSSTRMTSKPSYPHTHVRSASSTSSSNDQLGHEKTNATSKPTRHMPLKTSDLDMPPPQYVPTRPSQPPDTITPASRSTSVMDARKRTVFNSVRSGAVQSRAAQSEFLVRPASASGLHRGPRRAPCSSTASTSHSASGPRRIPLPEVKPETSDMKKDSWGIGTAVTRPLPNRTQSRVNAAPIKRAPESSKGVSSSSANAMPLPPSKPSRSVSQPTLSRIHATGRKLPTTTAIKPLWGQSGRSQAKSMTKPSINQQAPHKISKAQTGSRPTIPCQVPLPESRPETPLSSTRESSGSTTPVSISRSSPAVLPPTPQNIPEASTETPPKAECIAKASVQEAAVVDAGTHVKLSPSDADRIDESQEGSLSFKASSSGRESDAPINGTPQPLFSPGEMSGAKTPISALLTSIQHGFLLTPSSPLSPPQSYLHRDLISSEVGKDLSIFGHLRTDNPEQTTAPSRKHFIFGGACQETGRHALSNVENLDVQW